MTSNVLWIVTDDQPRHTFNKMPRTWSRIVDRGTRFARGYVGVPLCGPSRASFLTSTYPHNNGCWTNSTHQDFVPAGLDQDTIATRLTAAGYTCGYFGKYMNGHNSDPTYIAPGWQRWVAVLGAESKEVNVAGEVRTVAKHVDQFSADQLTAWLDNRARETAPWFAIFAPTNPHSDGSDPTSHNASPEHSDDYDGVNWNPPALNEHNMGDKPDFMHGIPKQNEADMRKAYEGKLEELQDVDDQVGQILDKLYFSGELDDTFIFFVSDNGYMLGEHRLVKKEVPYEECVGVPFAVRGPGVPEGALRYQLASLVDLMPTTLDIAGLDPDAGRELDGRSMLPHLLSGDWSGWRQRLLSEHPKEGWAWLRENGDVLIHHHGVGGAKELYDMTTDPDQMQSIHATSTKTAPMTTQLTALRQAKGRALRDLEV